MFEILSGKPCFWQWDSNQKLIVRDAAINEVHFCNGTDNCSLVCEVKEQEGKRVVNVPNILLQTAFDIKVYAVNKDSTKTEARYKVKRRTKPADYVYTETEIKRYEDLAKRLNAMEDNIGIVVKDYLEENPPTVDIEGYATIDYVDTSIKNIDFPKTDLTDYATKKYVADAVGSITIPKVDLTEYATINYVDTSISNIDFPEPDLKGYATEQYVKDAIPTYNNEVWVFTLESGETVEKEVLLK